MKHLKGTQGPIVVKMDWRYNLKKKKKTNKNLRPWGKATLRQVC